MAVRGVSSIQGASSQSSVSRALNTPFLISSINGALVLYSVQITVTASISGGQNGSVLLEMATDSGFTQNVQPLSMGGLGQTYTLAVALQGVQPQTSVMIGWVPALWWARMRTINNVGTPTYSYQFGQEILF